MESIVEKGSWICAKAVQLPTDHVSRRAYIAYRNIAYVSLRVSDFEIHQQSETDVIDALAVWIRSRLQVTD